MAYTFEQVFAADPANPANIAQNASITIFAPGDGTMTPIAITDPDGQPLANPIPVNANGFGSAFMADIDRVAWLGGGFTGFFTSYEGMKEVAVAAQAAAETAGADAAAAASAGVAGVAANADAAAASAAASATAAANSAALVGAPADTAIAAAINGTGATKTALNATIGGIVAQLGPSNGTDDSPQIQAALDAVRIAGGGKVLGKPGTWYKTRDRLVIGSNTEIDAWVELASGISVNILNNRAFRVPVRTVADAAITSASKTLTSATAAFTSADVGRSISIAGAGPDGSGGIPVGPINLSARILTVTNGTTVELDTAASTTVSAAAASLYDRDQNITVKGRWRSHNAGGPGTDVHHMLLCRVDGLVIDLDEFTSDTTGSKYGVYAADYTRLDLSVRGLDAISDGVHLQGPALGPNLVRSIEGKSHDDFLAVGTGDNTGLGRQLFSGGSMELEVQTLRPVSVGTKVALKLYGLVGHSIKAKVGRVTGVDAGLWLGAADVQGVYLDDVTVDSVENAVASTVSIYANAGRISLRKVTNRHTTAASVVFGANVTTGFTVNSLDVGELNMPDAGGTAGGGSAINVAGTVVELKGDRFVGTLPASGAYLMLGGTGSSVTRAMLSKITQTGGGALVKAATAGVILGEVWLRDTYQTGSSFFVDLNTTTILHLSNVEHWNGTSGSINLRASSNVTVLGHGASKMFGNLTTAAGYALRVNCADFSADVGKVTTVISGDRFINTNATPVPYVTGPLLYADGAWRPAWGYVKSGTATLVGGTVAVADTKVTGSARIRVSTLVPGGTVGTAYIASRTAGTGFTITSTNAADTSVIFYEVVSY